MGRCQAFRERLRPRDAVPRHGVQGLSAWRQYGVGIRPNPKAYASSSLETRSLAGVVIASAFEASAAARKECASGISLGNRA